MLCVCVCVCVCVWGGGGGGGGPYYLSSSSLWGFGLLWGLDRGKDPIERKAEIVNFFHKGVSSLATPILRSY